ncbi:hypothetical protein Moror_17536 [Moniliophthora roreri MCA 2997]|uniref:Uncharacterized protein n=2 Tax=Moniliophthora roreri TaxID=221103 RepID=V2XXD6_MONRO|nr:hypothetical protein Moror_17536 [Moniliophthora roreri MCA 2997]KAI3612529.1 hypothetical protein WG66_009913 [Moniliophthora roreri]
MKGSVLFSPSTWRRKKKVAETSASPPASPSFFPSSSLPRPTIHTGNQYSPLYAQSAIDLGSPIRSFPYSGRPSPLPSGEPPVTPPRASYSARKYSDSEVSNGGKSLTRGDLMRRSTSDKPPRRPPRPPSLEHDASRRSKDVEGGIAEPQRPALARRSQSSTLPQSTMGKSLRPKGSMPELDGVWKGFLEEVDEDFTSLGGNHSLTPQSTTKQRRRSNTAGQFSNSNRFKDLPPSPSFNKEQFNPAPSHPMVRSHSESTPHSHRKGNVDDPFTTDEYENPPPSPTPDFPLSLFPAPPPLVLKKKPPKPLVLSPAAIAPVLSPTPSPSTSSSSDSTPVATPTTPTQMSLLHPKHPSPTGILKSASRDSSSRPHYPPVLSSSIRSPNRSYSSAPIIRPSQSITHLSQLSHSKPQALPHVHRTTSSDSISSSSTNSRDGPRERVWTFPVKYHSMTSSYLKSSGRKPRRPVYHPGVEFGIAV